MQQEYLGRVAYSRAGRDKGKPFIVVGIVDQNYMLVADGDLRKIERPKKKSIKHLNFSKQQADDIKIYLKRGEMPPNHIVRKALIELLEHGK